MTSANVTHYELYGRDWKLIDTGRQHALCKDSISDKLEQWEKDHPDALLALRWPDENEVDQYLTFDTMDGYPEDLGTEHEMDGPRDMISIGVYMRRKRQRKIAEHENTIDYLRKRLREFTGDGRLDDYEQQKAFREFREESRLMSQELGEDVMVRCHANGGKFKRDFLLVLRRPEDVVMAKEAVAHFYGTGRVPTYDEPYPEEG